MIMTEFTLNNDNDGGVAGDAGARIGQGRGATSSYVFQATTNRTASGSAIVKVFCVPISKHGEKPPMCSAKQTMGFMQVGGRSWLAFNFLGLA